MKVSETQPTAWKFGAPSLKLKVLMHRWEGTRKNVVSMEDTLLLLMQNPQTTPEQMSMAAKLYANVAQRLADSAKAVDDYLYHGIKPEPKKYACTLCGSSETPIEEGGAYPHCPDCKGV
jgi:hypothetical protein